MEGQDTFIPRLITNYSQIIENIWTSKTLSTYQIQHYLVDEKLICPEFINSLKIREDRDNENFFDTITARWDLQKIRANTDLAREIWSTTIRYKGLVCKLTTRLVATLNAIEEEILSTKERNIDNILNRQVIWNREIETWKHGILESAKVIQTYFKKYVPRYQTMLREAGSYNLEDINAILNRLVLHTNHIIIGNIQYATNVEIKLKLAYNSIIKDEIIKIYYEVTLERANIPNNLMKPTKVVTDEDTLWKKQIFQDLMLIHDMFKAELPEPTPLPELVHYIDLLDGSMKYLFYYQLDIMKLIYIHIKKIIDEPGDPEEDDKTLAFWKEFISLMKESILESKNIVEKGLNSWHQTLSRMELVKVMIKAAVDQHRCANVYHEEMEINILLDKLRDCPELKLLNGNFQRIKTIFEKYEKRIEAKQAEELKIISVLPRSFNISRDLFEAACNALMDYTENVEIKETNANKPLITHEDANIGKTIQKIYRHLQTVKSWRRAFSDTLKMISAELKNILPVLTGTWNYDMQRDILDWYKNKLDSLYRRKFRIKTDIVDVRAAEIEDHNLRLKRHIAGIYDNYDTLSKLENVKESLARINEDLEDELNKEQTLSLLNALRINEQYKKMKKKFDDNRVRKSYLIKRETENVERLFHWMATANKNFLKSIRFFGENGNFSPKEAQIAVIAVQRVEGLMPVMKSQIIKLIKEVEGEFRIKPTVLTQKEDLKLMMRKHVELEFKELVVVEMSQLRGQLIDEARKVMKSIKTLESKTRGVDSWRPDVLKTLLNNLQSIAIYLSLPEFMKKIEIEVPPAVVAERTYDKKEMMIAISRNYAQDLQTGAPFPPSFNQENFIYKTKSYLNNTITKLQKSARIFFFKSKEEKRRKVGAPAPVPNRVLYRNFMENLISILKGYNLQCERIWLEYILDFLSIVRLTHDRFMNFITKLLKSTWIWWKLKLKQLNDNYTNTYDTITKEAEEERSALKYEMKPWLGYPDKKPRMSILAKKATDHCRQLVRILCQDFQEFKDNAKNIMKNIFLLSTQLFMKLKVLRNVLIEHRGLQLIFTNIATFIDRYTKEFFDSQIKSIPGSTKLFQTDFLLEPGGRSRLWSIPKKTVLTISEAEIDTPVSTMEVPSPESSINILKAPMEVEVDGILFKTGFTTNMELISDLARLLKIVSNVPLNFNPDLRTTVDEKEKMNQFLNFDLDKKILSLKRIFRNKWKFYITKNLRKLDLLIRQLEKWHTDWNHDFKEINKLYEPDPFYD